MMFMWIPFLIIPLAIVWFVRHENGAGDRGWTHAVDRGPQGGNNADLHETVRRRFARGEITPEQYAKIIEALGR